MGILRTDRITGLGGANAITGSTFFGNSASSSNGSFLRIETGTTDDFAFGTGDFTIEFWFNRVLSTHQQHFYDFRGTTNTNTVLLYMTSNVLYYFGNGAERITSGTVPSGEWVHFALVRSSASTKMYFNGTQTGSTYSDSLNLVGPDKGSGFIGSNGGTDGIIPSGSFLSAHLSNFRVQKGKAEYTAAFTPPTHILEKTPETVLLTCNSASDSSNEETGKVVIPTSKSINSKGPEASRFTPNSPVGFSTTTDVGSQYGSTFDGFGNFATSTYMVPPAGNTRERNRGRGLLMGGAVSPGATNTTQIKYFDIASQGITEDFGQTTVARRSTGSLSSSTRGLMAGGFVAPTSPAHTVSDVIDFVTIASTANAIDFGNMQSTGYAYGTASNETRGLFAGGYRPNNSAVVDTIDLITIATTGNASDFGNLVIARRSFGGLASPTRGIFMGGAPSTKDEIDYVTIATAGNATDFGNLTDGRDFVFGSSSSTRGVMGGGRTPSNTNIIDFITIASEGNATDFGDLLSATYYNAATGNSTRAVWVGTPSITNTMEYVTIATTGNSVDWGDQGGTIHHSGGACSDSHGGLS